MIYIGLTGWGDHPELYSEVTSARDKLFDYSGHFPIVEVDTSFYAIPNSMNVDKWCQDVPDNFQFVLKAYQGMTGHQKTEDIPFETRNDMFNAFIDCANAFKARGKLAAVLVQFPPWFDCTAKHVQYIRYVRQQLEGLDVAIEFRNQTWYGAMAERTFQFLREHAFIHTVCDEPQAGVGSVPFVATATADKVVVRIHGRNIHGWRNVGNAQNWRKVRFLYDYNEEELQGLALQIRTLQQQAKDVYVLFNNNSGNHAAANAKRLQQLLNVRFEHLSPKQMNIFEGDFE